jgi:Icc-related predicted phosphoesterase
MTKIRLVSDVHNEFGKLKLTILPTDLDTVLIVAGDFTVGATHADLMRKWCKKFKAVIFVCGNHEYYNNVMEGVDEFWSKFHLGNADGLAPAPNFHFLNPGVVVVDDTRFIGGTFWTDLDGRNPLVEEQIRYSMNDYRLIRMRGTPPYGKDRTFQPVDGYNINIAQRKFFSDELDKPFAGKTVMVTHHAPHEVCVHPRYKVHARDHFVNFAYVNCYMDKFFEEKNFDLWVHGHIHDWQEHEVHGKKIIARPRGYIGHEQMANEYDREQKDALIIEV